MKKKKNKKRKLKRKGFTLVELLAVIVIMGILMMNAMPDVTRTIENSRKDIKETAKDSLPVLLDKVVNHLG